MKLLKLIPDNTNLDFMRWRNLALVLSLIATVASIAFTIYRGLNLGVDFVGGQLIRVPVDDIRTVGRNSQGVTVFSTKGKEKVVSVEHIEGEDAEEGDDTEANGDAGGDIAEGGEE